MPSPPFRRFQMILPTKRTQERRLSAQRLHLLTAGRGRRPPWSRGREAYAASSRQQQVAGPQPVRRPRTAGAGGSSETDAGATRTTTPTSLTVLDRSIKILVLFHSLSAAIRIRISESCDCSSRTTERQALVRRRLIVSLPGGVAASTRGVSGGRTHSCVLVMEASPHHRLSPNVW